MNNEPARNLFDVDADIAPNLHVVPTAGEAPKKSASLKLLKKQELNPDGTPAEESIEEREKKGSNVVKGPDSWFTDVSGKGNSKTKSKGTFFKKNGPIAFIICVLLGGGGIGMLGPTLMMPSLLGNILQRYNIQETSLSGRTDLLVNSKMTDDATSGSCTLIKIACKFSRPSNRFLTNLEKNGIEALDASGAKIVKTGLIQTTRPAKYRFTNKAGVPEDIEAKNLYKVFKNNPEFRASFHTASRTRFVSLADSFFQKIKLKFNFNSRYKLKGVKNIDDVVKNIDNEVTVNDTAIKNAARNLGDDGKNAVKNIVLDEADIATKKVSKAGKGSLINLVAGVTCIATDIPGMTVKASRAFQMKQAIKYAALYLSSFAAIKAGDATPSEVEAIGRTLTKVVDGRSAVESFGVSYANDNNARTSRTNYKDYAPGGSMIKKLGGVIKITSSPSVDGACDAMTNPVTGEAITGSLAVAGGATFGAALVAAGINLAAGYAISKVIEVVLPPILEVAVGLLPLDKILTMFFGDFTKGKEGEPVGDLINSGASHAIGQVSNLSANMPLSVADAVTYRKVTQSVQLAFAEEDRATLSPFDTSSPYTMLGSFVQKLSPLYVSASQTGSYITSTLATVGSIVTKSFGVAFQPLTSYAASNDASEYKMCDDPDLLDKDVAAGPFCNIIYGIPAQYLDGDPVAIAESLYASGDIDEDGTVIDKGEDETETSLAGWMEMCTDGRSDQASNCKITDQKTANYALFTIDKRVQMAMDGEDPVLEAAMESGYVGFYNPNDNTDNLALDTLW